MAESVSAFLFLLRAAFHEPARIIHAWMRVRDEEHLARFVMSSSHVRKKSGTVKPNAFMPHKGQVSVTRHFGLNESRLWKKGQRIARGRVPSATLYGRADILAKNVRRQKLSVNPAPVWRNVNHANLDQWPDDKATQKMIAQELAKLSIYVAKP